MLQEYKILQDPRGRKILFGPFHSLLYTLHTDFILTTPQTYFVKVNNGAHVAKSGSCLIPHLAQHVSNISYSCSFPLS